MISYDFGVTLNPISDINFEFLRIWRNDPEIYKWCRQYEPLEKWHHENWYNSLVNRSDIKMYLIKDTSTPVGVCGLINLNLINRHAEFSLYIASKYWGDQFGFKALKTLCAHAFLAIGLNHIYGESYEGNPAVKMFERVGFKFEGIRRKYYYRNGKFIDASIHSILADEFRKKWKL